MATPIEKTLAHHGVIGMHWGQHLPGRGGVERATKTPKRHEPHPDHVEVANLTRNKTKTLSTSELKKVNDRLNTEKKYRDMNPTTLSKGKKITLGIIAGLGTGITLYNQINSPAGKLVRQTGKKTLDKLALKFATTYMTTL